MANQNQNKRAPKTNKPKLTTKEKKAKKALRAAKKAGGVAIPAATPPRPN